MAIKKTIFPAEQKRPDVQAARADFMTCCSLLNASNFIFLDESGSHLGMNRLYGRGIRHERIKSFAPFNKGTRVTLIAAIGIEEIKAAMFGQWHINGDIFLQFIRECLVPVLQPGQFVLMDNLSAHKVSGVRESIESTGARLVYLPPYSPDLSPIELAWSKIKAYLRKKVARTFDELQQAICEAFASITPSDLLAWFEHCGYCN